MKTPLVPLVPIGIIHTGFKEKFGIPRQSGLVPGATGKILMQGPYNTLDAFEGLEEFDYIWLTFIFHKHIGHPFMAKIRPPRLGGKIKKGIFATRGSIRPNSLGLSVVKLKSIQLQHGQVEVHVEGVDLLDQTPIVDIRPYIPAYDSFPHAKTGWLEELHKDYPLDQVLLPTLCSPEFLEQCAAHALSDESINLLKNLVEQDPRPAYHSGKGDIEKEYVMHYDGLEIGWSVQCDEHHKPYALLKKIRV